MSQAKNPPKGYRGILEPVAGADRYHLGEPLITVSPKDLHARTKLPTIFNMAVHSLITASMSRARYIQNLQEVTFDMKTLAGRMQFFSFEYEAMAPSLDGKARDQYVEVSKLAAIGGSDEGGAIAESVLNEGSKNLSGKSSKTS